MKWLLNLCAKCVSGRQTAWTFDPVSITDIDETVVPTDHEASAKQWRAALFGFPLKGNLVFLRISLRNPLFTDGNHGAVKTQLCNSTACFQLKHWISKTITPILMWIFYVFPVYFEGKFVGGALANWYGKLAPVVDQCFQSQKHWIFAFFSSEKEPSFVQKQFQSVCLRLAGTMRYAEVVSFFLSRALTSYCGFISHSAWKQLQTV